MVTVKKFLNLRMTTSSFFICQFIGALNDINGIGILHISQILAVYIIWKKEHCKEVKITQKQRRKTFYWNHHADDISLRHIVDNSYERCICIKSHFMATFNSVLKTLKNYSSELAMLKLVIPVKMLLSLIHSPVGISPLQCSSL